MLKALLCITLLLLATSTELTRELHPVSRKKLSTSAPVKLIYIDGLTSWWGNLTVPAALGIPGFTATPLPYTHIALAFWTAPGSAQDAVGMWATIGQNMGPNSYGTTTP